MYQSNLKFEQLSEKAKQQAMETYDNYQNGEYTVIDDVIIMRCETYSIFDK